MDEKIEDNPILLELKRLGDSAQAFSWPAGGEEKRQEEQAIDDFVQYFEGIPELIFNFEKKSRENKTGKFSMPKNFCGELMVLAIKYGRIDVEPQTYLTQGEPLCRPSGERRVLLAAGRTLSRLGEKYPETKDPAINYLKREVRNGSTWRNHIMPAAQMKREDALEILAWAVVGSPEWINIDLVRLAIEGAVLPYCMDDVLADTIAFDLKKEDPVDPEAFVSVFSESARETLGIMLSLNPVMEDGATLCVERAERTAARLCKEILVPVVVEAAEQVRETIYNAGLEVAAPKDAERSVIEPLSPDRLAL